MKRVLLAFLIQNGVERVADYAPLRAGCGYESECVAVIYSGFPARFRRENGIFSGRKKAQPSGLFGQRAKQIEKGQIIFRADWAHMDRRAIAQNDIAFSTA